MIVLINYSIKYTIIINFYAAMGQRIASGVRCSTMPVQVPIITKLIFNGYIYYVIAVQVIVQTPNLPTPYSAELPADLLKIGRALAGGHIPTIAKAVFSHAPLKEEIVLKVLDTVSNECGDLCRKGPDNISLFRNIPLEQMEEFEWAQCIEELQKKAPTLLRLLSTIVQHNDHRNTSKRGDRHSPGINMAVAVLLKERNREMCGLQSLTALLLFKGQAHKKASVM